MKCEKCGKPIDNVIINRFTREGNDIDVSVPIIEYDNGAVSIETDSNWCGYDLSEEEKMECISCPCCGEFPFEHKEVQEYEILRLVCFKKISQLNQTLEEKGE